MVKRCEVFLILSFSLLLFGCRNKDNNSDKNAPIEVTIGCEAMIANQPFDVKEVLAKYNLDAEKEKAIVDIIDDVEIYLSSRLDGILKKALHKKKRASAMMDLYSHGEVSLKTLEYMINDRIEEYNDGHKNNRLHTVTLETISDTISLPPAYNELLVKDWIKGWEPLYYGYEKLVSKGIKDDNKRKEIVNQLIGNYYKLLQAENLFGQMIDIQE